MIYNPALKARPTTYRGIQMRSRTEARYAAWLDTWCEWTFEPNAFKDRRNEWLPDFRLLDVPTTWTEHPVTVFVEVKPAEWLTQVDDLSRLRLLRRMAAVFGSDPSAVVLVEQSGRPGNPDLVRLNPWGVPEVVPAHWLMGIDGRPVLGLEDAVEWGDWQLGTAA
jgi:hypothetical protein